MRGFAILAVIAIHVSMTFPLIGAVTVLSTLNMLVFVQLQFAVPMFIFISGFVLSLGYSGRFSMATFYRRRFKTILPAYILFSLVYTIISGTGLFSAISDGVPSIPTFALDLLTGSAYYHLWFFVLIIQLYLLYPLIIGLYDLCAADGREQQLLLALLGLQILWSGMSYIVGDAADPVWYSIMARTFIAYIFYFVAGIYVQRNFDRIRDRVGLISWEGLLIVFLAITAGLSLLWITGFAEHGAYGDIPPWYLVVQSTAAPFYYPMIFALAYLLARRLAGSMGAGAVFLKRTGDYSFGIYLIHPLFIALAAEVLDTVFALDWSDWAYYPAVFLIALALSYLSVSLLARLPASELFIGTRAQRPRGEE